MVPPVGDVEASFFAVGAEFAAGDKFTVSPVIYVGDYLKEEAAVDKDDGEFTMFGVMFRFYTDEAFSGFYMGGMIQFMSSEYDDYDWNSVTQQFYYDQSYSDLLIGPSFLIGGKIPLGGGVILDPNFQIGFSISTEGYDTTIWGAIGVNVGVAF